jgi:hypothetical protein
VLDELLWGPESPRRLLVVHVALSLLIGARIVLGPYRQLAGQPAVLFDPVPVLWFLDRMPPLAVLVALQVIGGAAAAAAALRRHPRAAFAVAWVCLLVLAGLRGSRGKILHNDLLLLWCSAPLLLAPVTARWQDREPSRRHGWPIRTATVLAALAYFLAGYHKLRRSGPSWVLGDNMQYVMLWGPSLGAPPAPDIGRWVGEHAWASHSSAAFILGLELGAPVVLFARRLMPLFAVAAVVLHVGTYVLLGLDYWAWVLTVVVLFVDWPRVVDRLVPRTRRDQPSLTGGGTKASAPSATP